MSIENLLAQGYQSNIEPYGNALMRAQEFKAKQQANALMQMQAQDLHAQRALALQQAQQQAAERVGLQSWRDSLTVPQGQPQMAPGAPARNAAQAESAVGLPGYGASSAQPRMMPGQVDPRLAALTQLAKVGGIAPKEYVEAAYPQRKIGHAPAGSGIFDERTGQLIGSIPDKPEKEAEDVRLLKQVYGDGTPEFMNAMRMLATKKTTHAPAAQQITYGSPVPVQLADGTITYVQPGNKAGAPPQMMTGTDGKPLQKPVDQKEKDLTEASAKATTYLGQMRSASKALEALKMDQSALSVQAETALAGGPANIAIGAKAQQVRQAQDQWSEAFLRFKTGAASTPAEMAANRKTFFPSIGDKPENVAQKKAMRASAERDMEIAAGRGVKQLDGRATKPGVMKFDAQGNLVE